jgi:hypothetical protein
MLPVRRFQHTGTQKNGKFKGDAGSRVFCAGVTALELGYAKPRKNQAWNTSLEKGSGSTGNSPARETFPVLFSGK